MPASRLVRITRTCGQRTNEKITSKQVEFIIKRALGSTRGKNWDCQYILEDPEKKPEGWYYRCSLNFTKISGQSRSTDTQWTSIFNYLEKACNSSKFKIYPWKIEQIDDKSIPDVANNVLPQVLPQKNNNDEQHYASMSLEKADFFKNIFDRNSQIEIIYRSVITAQETYLKKRFHCVLYGLPGCGKTEILDRFSKMLGEEGKAFFRLDATSTTAAGAFRLLTEAVIVPPVLIVEEIEKADEKTLHWLLGILDDRAEILKTNYRIGQQRKAVPMLCLATANDIDLFNHMMSGALASRFPHKIHCPRPNREVLRLILEREVKEINGDESWIEPTLKFCYDIFNWTDPRTLTPICLCGKDKLLDGSYQRDLINTLEPSIVKERESVLKKHYA